MKEVVEKLIKLNKSISTMESCTGGFLASSITNIPGASEIFKFGAVTYSNDFKIKMGVAKETIDKYSVYSKETAHNMAKSIALFTNSNYAIGVTGMLKKVDPFNPSNENNKVYFCIYDHDRDIYYDEEMYVLKNTRSQNKKEILDQVVNKLKSLI